MVPLMINEPAGTAKANFHPGKTLADGNYIAVDTMNNGIGNMSGTLNPLAFDPYSGTLCFVHRSYTSTYAAGQSSGQLWYNISTDFGATWSRVPGGINTANSQKYGRYPSMGISNPAKGPIAGTTAFFAWPELTTGGAGFGWVGYAADRPAGSGAPAPSIDQGTATHQYDSDVPCWASDNSSDMFWVADYGVSSYGIDLFTTPDFGTITKVSPPQWSDSALGSWGSYQMGGASWNGVQYMAVFSAFSTFLNPAPLILPGVSKSTDNGATWSNFDVCDFRKISKLAKYDEILTFGGGFNQGDIHVDKNGNVHLVVQVAVTTTNAGTYAEIALVDLFEIGTGWDATIITTDLDVSASACWNNASGMGGGQMGPSSYLAFDSTRTIMAVQYVNKGTSPYGDVFLTYKLLNDAVWATPINLTHSDSTDNSQSHLAPFLRTVKTGNSVECTAFSMYGYELGNTGPLGLNGNACVAYLGAEKFNVTVPTVPVELFSFTANVISGIINLNWSTASEVNNLGFNVERSANKSDWTKIAFVQGHQNSTSTIAYSYFDKSVSKSGKYYYRLKQLDDNGSYKYSNIVAIDLIAPATFDLCQNFPNPFNPTTTISYTLPERSKVVLSIYNELGQKVAELFNGEITAGSHSVEWNAGKFVSGVYFYELKTEKFTSVKKLILMK
jgi:hypothetical protein